MKLLVEFKHLIERFVLIILKSIIRGGVQCRVVCASISNISLTSESSMITVSPGFIHGGNWKQKFNVAEPDPGL